MTPYRDPEHRRKCWRESKQKAALKKKQKDNTVQVKQPPKEQNPDPPMPESREQLLERLEKEVDEEMNETDLDVEKKRFLAKEFQYWDRIRRDDSYARAYRSHADDKAANIIEKLRVLCHGDSDLISRLLHGRSKADMDEEERREAEEKRNQ